ncbi:hypothetical protein GCM10027566_33960 [Arachidicoccus ginsenosidivorans]|uniref:PKD domain-containing protein n=1 Tax=Arachidicoccus ginsenosidivorans TaxID=496057 RepID=A0A5B8VJ70_9BACT|nr:PKD domain-containing protein [Arachidicoccus ginsenosidivorans]QEC71594.1 PKD domain-containing protein [Arachidicoccus ginsenosidivorans]
MLIETKRLLPLLMLPVALVFGSPLMAQQNDSLAPQIGWTQKESLIQFQPNLRPLRQIAGAPEAFYTYFWEFGDGNFSFDESPIHGFSDTGSYNVQLYATNNYDDGKTPPTRPRRINVTQNNIAATNQGHTGFFSKGNQIQLKVNRMPKPGEDMVCIIGYQNPGGSKEALNGSLVLFYNDKAFKKKNFGLTDLRNYHKEQTTDMTTLLASCESGKVVPLYAYNQIPSSGPNHFISSKIVSNNTTISILQGKNLLFETSHSLHFEGLKAGEQRYVYAILHTTPEMIKDTNATVTISALMIPDDPEHPVFENNLALQIVASHDPNRLMLRNRRLNYRFMGQHKKLKYKVRFQNTGKGPTSTIKIGIKVPTELDASTLTLIDQYPKCIPCSTAEPGQSCLDTLYTKDSIHFIFKNIYLPGMRQQGVEDKDSTNGFVQYQLQFKEKPPKIPFWSQAGIIFDKNEPVYTNKMHTRFIKGLSPTVIAGYLKGFGDQRGPNSPFILGGALAPYSPYRFYFQVEAYLGIHQKSTSTQFNSIAEPRDTSIQGIGYMVTERGNTTETSLVSLDIVPLEIRKNLNDWFSLGSGLWLQGNLKEKSTITPLTRVQNIKDRTIVDIPGATMTQTKTFSHINPGAFIDLNVGKVRVGPALGLRLLHFFSPGKTGVMAYALWRL